MAQRSPTAEGFRTIVSTPSLWLAEVAWRWTFGISTGLLLFLAACEFLASVKVSNADALFLRSENPVLSAAVLTRVLQGGAYRLLRIAAVLLPVISGLWVFASALGRTAVLKVMLANADVRLRTMLGLSFLRAALSVTALAALLGAARLPSIVYGDAAKAVAVISAVGAVLAWAVLNWLLSLAAIRAKDTDTLGAIISALCLLRRRTGALAATGAWFGLMHTVAAVGAFTAVVFALSLVAVSGWAALFVLVLVLAGYLAVVDFFYIARLAAYAAIAESSDLPSSSLAVPEGAFQ